MKLVSFRVSRFRNVLDSTEVSVQPDVTCLVGKNESGKTAMLAALYRLNPVYAARFDIQDDYPRWRLVPDRRKKVVDSTSPVIATFELQAADVTAVEEELGTGVLTGRVFKAIREYGRPETLLHFNLVDSDIEQPSALRHLLATAGVEAETAELLADFESLEDLRARASEMAKAEASTEEATKIAAECAAVVTAAEAVVQRGGFTGVAAQILRERLPRFFYFANYNILPGRIDLQALVDTEAEEAAASPEQTARSLLRLAETTPQDLMGDEYERRKSELEAVSNDLTRQVLEYWTQNPDLRVVFDIDPVVTTQPNGYQTVVRRNLEVRVEDRRHEFTNNFSQRSSGFQWFFSFLAAFTEFEESDTDVVVLLDEPALTLHGKAQADFLRFINDRLAPVAQVIYTTHSPFLVETDRIDRVRVVEDRGPDEGTVVSSDVLTVGDDTLFPLQAALGYDIAQHLFVGDTNLLVEGPSDYLFLDIFSRHLRAGGGEGLDPAWRILTAGGSGNIPAFVTLMGRELQVTVLVDSGTEGTGRLQAAIAANRLSRRRLVTVSEIIGRPNGDIEDLFDEADYLSLYNRAFETAFTSAQVPPGDRIVKRIEQLAGTGRFDHSQPAYALLMNQAELMQTMSSTTLDAFQRLITRVNGTLSS